MSKNKGTPKAILEKQTGSSDFCGDEFSAQGERKQEPEQCVEDYADKPEDLSEEQMEEPPEEHSVEYAEEPMDESEEYTYASLPPTGTVSSKVQQKRNYLLARRRVFLQKLFRKLFVLVCIFAVIAGLGIAFWYYVQTEENTLEVTFYHLKSETVSTPFRIVQLSDLHLHEFGEKNAELVDWVKRLNPDIITITGDMNNHYNDDTHVVMELCTQLVKITEVYYVMGNHEWVDYADRKTSIKDDIIATGVTYLQNSYVEREINGNKVVIGGLVNEVSNYYKYNGRKFIEKFMNEDGFRLLLVHYPEYFLGTLNHYAIDLAMCGHVHGGIIRIPHFGGLYSSDQGFFPELSEGMQTVSGGTVVVISRGLGGESKIPRINNNPEIVVVDVSWY